MGTWGERQVYRLKYFMPKLKTLCRAAPKVCLQGCMYIHWEQSGDSAGIQHCLAFFCLAPPPFCLATSFAYSLYALLVCLSFFLKASFLLLWWVDDFCKDCNIWEDLLPVLSSASIFSVFSFLEDAVFIHLWGLLPILQLLHFLHAYPVAFFYWAFQSYQFIFTLKPKTLNPNTAS